MKQKTLGLWYEESIGAASDQYGLGFNSILGLLKKIFMPYKFYLPNNQLTTTMSVLIWVSLYIFYVFIFKSDRYQERLKPSTYSIVVFLALLGFAGLIQEMLIFEIFRFQNSCSPLYLVITIFIVLNLPKIEQILKRRIVQAAIGIYFILLIAKFPHAASWFPIYEGSFSSFSESKIPIFKWHRFEPDVQAYYDDLSRHLCDGRKKIINITFDSTIPYLCQNQENALAVPIYYLPMVSYINPEKFAAIERGEFHEDELIVTEKIPLPVFPKVKLIELGKIVRPKTIRFWPGSIVMYRVEIEN